MMEDDLIIKYMTGELTAEEKSEVDAWLKETALNQKRFDSFQKLWRLAANYTGTQIPDKSHALEQVKRKLSAKNNPIPLKKYVWAAVNKWRIAAVVACLLAGISAWLLFNGKTDPVAVTEEVFAGETILADNLPDGSVITLNKHSKISYRKGLPGNTRTVQLAGEAFFAVAHDALRPFVVLAGDIVITDIGTSFNVRNYADTIEIMVATGIVSVKRDNDSVILRAGERLVAVAHSGRLRKQIIQPFVVQPSPKKQKRAARQLPSSEESREMMREIINDLVTEKIVAGKDSLSWFGLDSSQFVVDGRSQPAALHEKFRRKYLKITGFGYFYGPVKVYGQGVFFEKKDLYK